MTQNGFTLRFTGVSDPYEAPRAPEIHLDTSTISEDESFNKVISSIENRGFIPCEGECKLRDYSIEEELQAWQHLVALGFAGKLADL